MRQLMRSEIPREVCTIATAWAHGSATLTSMVAKKTWTLTAMPDRRLIARVSERVREVATLRTLVDMQCNRYAIYRDALLAVGHEHVAWPTCRKDVAARRLFR